MAETKSEEMTITVLSGTPPNLQIGSLVVVGTKRGTFVAKVRKITKRDIVIRAVSRPVR